jgi:hypothetical protein
MLIRWICALLLVVAVGALDAPAAAAAATGETSAWMVLEKHGRVRYRPQGERSWWTARTGEPIPAGSSIAADDNGFLIVARDGTSITVHPHGRLALPDASGDELVRQEAGNLRYRVARVPGQRFAVDTPYLSLVVKGTVFDVGIAPDSAEVEVTEGRVVVDTPAGQVAELTPGHGARVSAGGSRGLEVRAGPELGFAPASPSTRVAASDVPGRARGVPHDRRGARRWQTRDRAQHRKPRSGQGARQRQRQRRRQQRRQRRRQWRRQRWRQRWRQWRRQWRRQ